MAFLAILVGLVALVQGVVWLGSRASETRRGRGAALAPAGLIMMGGGLLGALVPGFFG